MVPLCTLLFTFGVFRFGFHKPPQLSGRWALAVMLLLTGGAHFVRTSALVAMVPPFLPGPTMLVYLTGAIELAFALMLIVRPAPWLGWVLAGFLVLVFPANIYSAVARVGMAGHGPVYLLFRVPLQALFIGWTLWCSRR